MCERARIRETFAELEERDDDMQVGFKLMAETFDPREIVRQAVEAERAGFDFVG